MKRKEKHKHFVVFLSYNGGRISIVFIAAQSIGTLSVYCHLHSKLTSSSEHPFPLLTALA